MTGTLRGSLPVVANADPLEVFLVRLVRRGTCALTPVDGGCTTPSDDGCSTSVPNGGYTTSTALDWRDVGIGLVMPTLINDE